MHEVAEHTENAAMHTADLLGGYIAGLLWTLIKKVLSFPSGPLKLFKCLVCYNFVQKQFSNMWSELGNYFRWLDSVSRVYKAGETKFQSKTLSFLSFVILYCNLSIIQLWTFICEYLNPVLWKTNYWTTESFIMSCI